jgi:hypothetical protein
VNSFWTVLGLLILSRVVEQDLITVAVFSTYSSILAIAPFLRTKKGGRRLQLWGAVTKVTTPSS